MVRLPRDFENDLLLELRTFARCKLKRKDPNHFCSNREFQQNLKMSALDVGKTLHNLVEQEKIKHERNVLYNGKLRDRFTIIDSRMYSPEERKIMCHSYNDYLLYIWMNLGDTNFNRLGYRKATDIFERAFLKQKETVYAH